MNTQPSSPTSSRWRLAPRRVISAVAVAALALGVTIAVAPSAVADPGPVASPNSTTGVTADALPTVQIDGVVWTQVVSGNVVYAGGSFTTARPAGAAAGVNTVTRNNLLAYDITTGALITSFAPSLNAQVKALALSPDGSTLYVGGSFTSANGQDRYRIAAYSTATGALLSNFAPGTDATVNAIVATNTTVYVGGTFSNANGVARARLAAFSASTGELLGWAPTADSDEVEAMVMSPAGDKLVVGGSFTSLNGSSSAFGLGALDPSTGALVPFAVSSTVRNAGSNSAILSLSTDGTAIYGTGYVYNGTGNLEGAFSADPSNGAVNWIEDCHGDTYDVFPVNGAVYTVSHAYDCSRVGGYPSGAFHRTVAFTAKATGTLLPYTGGGAYGNFGGQPSPSMINWFPDLTIGSYTGESQAAWSVSGNSKYVVLGGEFPTVNGVAQQGLVRFAVPSIAPDKQGPMVSGSLYQTTESPVSATSVKVSWPANWDRDDQTLTYQLIRDGDTNHPIYTTTATSQFWNLPTLSYIDTGLKPSSTHNYFVRVTDPNGNTVRGDYTTITTPATSPSAYAQQVLTDGALDYWRLDDAAGATTAKDYAGSSPLTEQSGVGKGAAGAIVGDSDTAGTFSGDSSGAASTSTQVAGPNVFSLETWFKTSTTSGGKLIGFGSSQTGQSSSYDRHIYMDNSGHLVFGVFPNSVQTVTSPATYNNNAWHQVVATLSSAGMKLYVDGALVAANAGVTTAQNFSGYWRVGGDSVNTWPSQPSSSYFAGTLDEVAVYPTALSLAQVQSHYTKSGRTTTGSAAPTAAFTSSCTSLTCSFDASTSSAASGATVSSYAWNFGDGSTATGVKPAHTYATAGTYDVTVTVTDSKGGTGTVTHSVAPTAPAKPTAAFTSSCTALTCSFDASTSSATTGATISSYAWTFGDNSSGTTSKPSHTYSAAGTFTVTLTVLDSNNQSSTVSKTVTTTAAPSAPNATFTSSCTNLSCTFDASATTVSSGSTVSSYAWTFGDNTTGTGVKPAHTYATAGSFTVTLTVKDSAGRVGSASKSVTVTAPATTILADAFSRTVSAGWGSADTGGAWNVGDTGATSVNGSVGLLTLGAPATTETASLDSLSATNLNLLFDVGMSSAPTGNGLLVSIGVRHTSTGEYRFKVRFLSDGSVHLVISKYTSAEGETVIREVAIAGLTYTAGTLLRARLQVSGTGTTTIAGKIWAVGSTEPAASQVTVTDNEAALQSAGSLTVLSYLAGNATNVPVNALLDNLSATGN